MPLLKKLIPVFLSIGIFIYIIMTQTPPNSWVEASTVQILLFFLPLLSFFTFLFNILFDYLPSSLALSLGILVLLVLESLGYFNFLTVPVTIIATFFLTRYFDKPLLINRKKGIIRKL